MSGNMDQFFAELDELDQTSQDADGFFGDLVTIIVCDRQNRLRRKKVDFFGQLDELSENETRLRTITQAQNMSFMQHMEEMARHEKLAKIIRRIEMVRAFDCFRYFPYNTTRTKAKYKQRSILGLILRDMYQFIAFGYKDPMMPVSRSKMDSFVAVRNYYRKYTGIEPGPRVRAKIKRLKNLKEVHAKNDAKKAMLKEGWLEEAQVLEPADTRVS